MRDFFKVAQQNEYKRRADGRHECCRVVEGVPCPEPAVDFILGDPGDRLEAQYPKGYPYWYCASHYDQEEAEAALPAKPPKQGRSLFFDEDEF
jgi:hypothetical protein